MNLLLKDYLPSLMLNFLLLAQEFEQLPAMQFRMKTMKDLV
jgi:hypothetical protein